MTIEVIPGGPVHVARSEAELLTSTAVTTPFTVRGERHVLPVGKPLDCVVVVNGWPHDVGGTLYTDRLTTGHEKHEYVLTVQDDPEIGGEIGLSQLCIDGVEYTATKP